MLTTTTPLITEALPDVSMVVRDLPPDAALVYSNITQQAYIIVAPYYGEHEPRPLICPKHGATRHDWNGKAYVCKLCKPPMIAARER